MLILEKGTSFIKIIDEMLKTFTCDKFSGLFNEVYYWDSGPGSIRWIWHQLFSACRIPFKVDAGECYQCYFVVADEAALSKLKPGPPISWCKKRFSSPRSRSYPGVLFLFPFSRPSPLYFSPSVKVAPY